MKKKALTVIIFTLCLLSLIVIVLFGDYYVVGHYAKEIESQYDGLIYKGITGGDLCFECSTSLDTNSGFSHDDCLNIMKSFEDKLGIMIFLYDIKIEMDIPMLDKGNNVYSAPGTISISFNEWRPTGYKTVVIDTSQYASMDSITNYSRFQCFEKYEIYGALWPYTSGDTSFLEYICDNSEIITDEYTYNEYISGSLRFGDLLEQYGAEDIKIHEDVRVYHKEVIH